jgi:tetratricopeptide (TPR) repeat protein
LKLGDDVKAERSFNKALELQPDLTVAHAGLILMYLSEGKFHEAHERSAKLLAISPSEFIALNIIGDAHLYSGDHRQAREFYEKAYSVSPYGRVAFTGWLRSTGLAYVYLKMGNARKANDLLNESLNRNLEELRGGSESPGVLYDLAAVHAVRGNKAEAYKWLQKAIDGGWIDYRIGRIDPLFENLRDDEDFKEMMDQVRVKVDEMRKRVEQTERE